MSKTIANIQKLNAKERHALLLHAVDNENKQHPQAKISVVDIENLNTLIQACPDKRYRVIVNNKGHYTAVDVKNEDGIKTCIICDAAGDMRAIHLYFAFEKNGFKPRYISGLSEKIQDATLQKDSYSCSLFAFDHCVQFYRESETFHDNLCKSYETSIPFDALPPNFIWNAQSFTVLDAYVAIVQNKNPALFDEKMPNGLTFHEYIQQGTCLYEDASGKEVTRNESINIHVLQNIEKMVSREELKTYVKDAFNASPIGTSAHCTVKTLTALKESFRQLRDALKSNEETNEPLEQSTQHKNPGD